MEEEIVLHTLVAAGSWVNLILKVVTILLIAAWLQVLGGFALRSRNTTEGMVL